VPTFTAGMTPDQIVSLFETVYAADGSLVKVTRLEPAPFAATPGVQLALYRRLLTEGGKRRAQRPGQGMTRGNAEIVRAVRDGTFSALPRPPEAAPGVRLAIRQPWRMATVLSVVKPYRASNPFSRP